MPHVAGFSIHVQGRVLLVTLLIHYMSFLVINDNNFVMYTLGDLQIPTNYFSISKPISWYAPSEFCSITSPIVLHFLIGYHFQNIFGGRRVSVLSANIMPVGLFDTWVVAVTIPTPCPSQFGELKMNKHMHNQSPGTEPFHW